MAYQGYVDLDYYRNQFHGSILGEDAQERLRTASRHIDALTYNRIVGMGFDSLTDFQKDIIKEAVCLQAEFESENADLLDTILSGYSLNGASVQFGSSWNIFTDKGIAMKKDTYALLCQTGLCHKLAR